MNRRTLSQLESNSLHLRGAHGGGGDSNKLGVKKSSSGMFKSRDPFCRVGSSGSGGTSVSILSVLGGRPGLPWTFPASLASPSHTVSA